MSIPGSPNAYVRGGLKQSATVGSRIVHGNVHGRWTPIRNYLKISELASSPRFHHDVQSRPFRIPADTFNIRQCRSRPCSPTLPRKPAFADEPDRAIGQPDRTTHEFTGPVDRERAGASIRQDLNGLPDGAFSRYAALRHGSPAQQLFCHGRNCTSGTTALRWGVHSPGRVSVYEESRATPPASTWIAYFAPDGR